MRWTSLTDPASLPWYDVDGAYHTFSVLFSCPAQTNPQPGSSVSADAGDASTATELATTAAGTRTRATKLRLSTVERVHEINTRLCQQPANVSATKLRSPATDRSTSPGSGRRAAVRTPRPVPSGRSASHSGPRRRQP